MRETITRLNQELAATREQQAARERSLQAQVEALTTQTQFILHHFQLNPPAAPSAPPPPPPPPAAEDDGVVDGTDDVDDLLADDEDDFLADDFPPQDP